MTAITSSATNALTYTGTERRLSSNDRRQPRTERRNFERLAEDDNPRRDPELPGRRASDLAAA